MNGNLKIGSAGLPGLFSLISKVTEHIPAAGTTAQGCQSHLGSIRTPPARRFPKTWRGQEGRGGVTNSHTVFRVVCLNVTRDST